MSTPNLNGVPLITRKAWGARRPTSTTPLPVKDAKGVALHYSASHAPASHSACAASVRAIQNMHMDDNDWNDVAYSHIFCIHGYAFQCRGIGKRTAANGSNKGNNEYYAICVLGTDNKDRADITPKLRWSLTRGFYWYDTHIPGGARFRPHSDFFATACPGDELRAFLRAGGWKP